MTDFAENGLAPRRGRPPLNHQGAVPPMTSTVVDQGSALGAVDPVRPAARRPFSSVEYKLAYENREGYHRHWFNEVASRISRAQEAGYEHVKGKDGKPVSRIVGVAEGGGPLTAFLMEIPEEWYKEDMTREQKLIDEKESAIKQGAAVKGVENGYVGAQGIKISQGS